MRSFSAVLLLVLFATFAAGCGGGGGGKSSGAVTGVVYAPNGEDPVPGASVSLYPAGGSLSGVRFPAASDVPAAGAVTGADGSFSIEGVPPGDYLVVVSSGLYARSVTASVDGDGGLRLTADQTTLPASDNATAGTEAPRFAVVTGEWDSMANVLAKFGQGGVDAGGALVPGTETFDLYLTPGAEWLSVWSDEYQCYENVDFHGVYPPSESLFSSLATLRQYDVIVLNCGYGSQYLLDNADVRARIHDFVQGGGRLYVTDRSYDFVEQVFPNYIRFQNGDEANPATPEPYDAAEAGVDYFDDAYTVPVTSNASVLDPDLAAWLSGMGSLNPDGTVHVEDFLYRWSVMVGPHTGTIGSQCKVWVEGSVPYYTSLDNDVETETGVRPLTVSFHYGTGKVIYTSYHTALDPHPGFTPQERILEYLLFESAR